MSWRKMVIFAYWQKSCFVLNCLMLFRHVVNCNNGYMCMWIKSCLSKSLCIVLSGNLVGFITFRVLLTLLWEPSEWRIKILSNHLKFKQRAAIFEMLRHFCHIIVAIQMNASPSLTITRYDIYYFEWCLSEVDPYGSSTSYPEHLICNSSSKVLQVLVC